MGVNNVTAQLGLTTYLHCKVNNLNGKTVSFNYIMELNSEYIFKNGAFFKANFGGFFSVSTVVDIRKYSLLALAKA